jgi:quercetin dioxygenase-like cupin family protein
MIRFTPAQVESNPDTSPIFVGNVTKKSMVTDDNSPNLRVNLVEFNDGARNRWHHHAVDQVLVVTSGSGIVANREEEFHVSTGDVVLIPANESHWHGAEAFQDFAHLAILTPGEMTIDE